MHSTVAFLNEYSYSSELKVFMLTLVCLLPSHSFWTENLLPECYVLKRNSAKYIPFLIFEQFFLCSHVFASFF